MEWLLSITGNGRFAPARLKSLARKSIRTRYRTGTILIALMLATLIAGVSKSSWGDPPSLFDNPTLPASRPSKMTSPTAAQMNLWVAQLADDDPGQRQAALNELMMLHRGDLGALRRAATDHQPLLPCQIVAMHHAVIHVFLASEEYESEPGVGLLGLSWPDPDECTCDEGLIVGDRIPGLSAYRMLHVGDIIVGSSRNPVRAIHTIDELKVIVSATTPGHTINLKVVRYGKVIEVPIVLDPKPVALGTIDQDTWTSDRLRLARQFWNTEFAGIDVIGDPTDEEVSASAIPTTQPSGGRREPVDER